MQDDIEVVGEASDGDEAVRLVLRFAPDVVLMDIRMPRHRRPRRHPTIAGDERLSDARIIILTTFELDEYVFEPFRLGRQRLPGEGHASPWSCCRRCRRWRTAARCSPPA